MIEQNKRIEQNIRVENAKLAFRNFAGAPGMYNAEGNRNFCVIFEKDIADQLARDGWNLRTLNPRDPDDEPAGCLQVNVKYGKVPPRIVLITSAGKTVLSEEQVSMLDWAEIKCADLVIRPYNWELPSGRQGVKAYLKTAYITIAEDEFAGKYRDVPDSALSAIQRDAD